MCSSDAVKSLDPSNVFENKAFTFGRASKGFQAAIDVVRGKDSFSENKDALRRGLTAAATASVGATTGGDPSHESFLAQGSKDRAERRGKERAALAAETAATEAETARRAAPKQEAGEFVGEDLRAAQEQRRRRSRAESSILTSPLGVTTGGRTSLLGG